MGTLIIGNRTLRQESIVEVGKVSTDSRNTAQLTLLTTAGELTASFASVEIAEGTRKNLLAELGEEKDITFKPKKAEKEKSKSETITEPKP